MKRLLSISLAVVYLLLSTGFNLHWHFCHGQKEMLAINALYSVEEADHGCEFCVSHLPIENQHNSCNCVSDSSDTDSHSSCCTDSHKYVRLVDNQLIYEFKKISPQSFDIFHAFENLVFDVNEGFVSTSKTELILYNYPPPFLFFQQLRFCA